MTNRHCLSGLYWMTRVTDLELIGSDRMEQNLDSFGAILMLKLKTGRTAHNSWK